MVNLLSTGRYGANTNFFIQRYPVKYDPCFISNAPIFESNGQIHVTMSMFIGGLMVLVGAGLIIYNNK